MAAEQFSQQSCGPGNADCSKMDVQNRKPVFRNIRKKIKAKLKPKPSAPPKKTMTTGVPHDNPRFMNLGKPNSNGY